MLGVLQGIALGVALSLLMLIYRTSHPQGAVLGQLPGTEAYRDVQRHPEALTFPGLLIWRAGGDLFFASIGHLDQGLKAALATHRPPARQLLLDADSVNFIDTSACDAVLNFIKELQSQGIIFAFARVRDEVREQMTGSGQRPTAIFGERLTSVQAFCNGWVPAGSEIDTPMQVGFESPLPLVSTSGPLRGREEQGLVALCGHGPCRRRSRPLPAGDAGQRVFGSIPTTMSATATVRPRARRGHPRHAPPLTRRRLTPSSRRPKRTATAP